MERTKFFTWLKEYWENVLLIVAIATAIWTVFNFYTNIKDRLKNIETNTTLMTTQLQKEIVLRQTVYAEQYYYSKIASDPHNDSILTYNIPPADTLFYRIKNK
jgi:hypothetical protein